MMRARHALLTLVAGAFLAASCSSSTPKDINFNTDAESGFEPPAAEVASDVADTTDVQTSSGTAGAGGAGGAAGATAGASGSAGSADAANDAVSDGGTGQS
jgi:hypothetical protein